MKSSIRTICLLFLLFLPAIVAVHPRFADATIFAQSKDNVYLPQVFKDGVNSPRASATSTLSSTPSATVTPTATASPTTPHTKTPTFTASPAASDTPTPPGLATATPTHMATQTPTATQTPPSTAPATAVPAPPGYIMSNNTWMIDAGGRLHIFGEAQNVGLTFMQTGYVTADTYSSDGQFLSSKTVVLQRHAIGPGEISCFHIDMDSPVGFSYYTLGGSYITGGAVAPSPNHHIGPLFGFNILGYPLIKGEVINDSEAQYGQMAIEGVLYHDDRVIGCSSDTNSDTSATALSPGQTYAYLVEFLPAPSLATSSWRIRISAYP